MAWVGTSGRTQGRRRGVSNLRAPRARPTHSYQASRRQRLGRSHPVRPGQHAHRPFRTTNSCCAPSPVTSGLQTQSILRVAAQRTLEPIAPPCFGVRGRCSGADSTDLLTSISARHGIRRPARQYWSSKPGTVPERQETSTSASVPKRWAGYAHEQSDWQSASLTGFEAGRQTRLSVHYEK